MTARIPARVAKLLAMLVASTALGAIAAGSAGAEIVYNNIPTPLPGNVVSQAFEATSTSEFGGEVEFGNSARHATAAVVEMSSWACQNLQSGSACKTTPGASFEWPITLNVYEVGPGRAPGALIGSKTSTFKIPYRPSPSKKCTLTSEGVVGWSSHCWSGKAFKIKFALEGLALPSQAIISVAYNTTDYGAAPTHSADVGEDSLNVGYSAPGEPVSAVGSSPFPNDGYLSSSWSGAYCNGAEGTGTFRLDSGCYGGYQPGFKVLAKK